jgi:ATP-binding protein involved in chromosome partitioning
MADLETLKSALDAIADPAGTGGLLSSGRATAPRLADGVAGIILDVTGLSQAQRQALNAEVEAQLKQLPGVAEVRIAMTSEKRVRPIIAIASGKGGVGKSTLSTNLAVALGRQGFRPGLVDADIYGPSQPLLTGSEDKKPEAEGQKLIAVETPIGVPLLSMGHLVRPGQAIAWRGPMAGNALGQLIDAEWGPVDLLVADMPPGTGDVQLSMVQKHKPAGAVIVSTPQDLALIDATRAIDLFNTAGVPIIGLIENMAGYVCPHCGEVSDPFGSGGAEAAARALGVDFLGRIPLDIEIRTSSDAGKPPAAGEGPHARVFDQIAARIADWVRQKGS